MNAPGRKHRCLMALLLAFVIFFSAGGPVNAGGTPINVRIVFPPDESKIYDIDNPKDQISFDLILKNVSGAPLWTREGFDELGFHRYLFLYGPLGEGARLITSAGGRIGGGKTPPTAPDRVAVEELDALMRPLDKPWGKRVSIRDLRDYFPLTAPGMYKLWFAMSFVQYDPAAISGADGNEDGKKTRYYVPYAKPLWSGVIEFKEEYITLKKKESKSHTSNVFVVVKEYRKTEQGSDAVFKKGYLVDRELILRLYDRSMCEEKYGPIDVIKYDAIATDPVLNANAMEAERLNLKNGQYVFRNVRQNDYLVIAHATARTNHKHLGSEIDSDNPGWAAGKISRSLIYRSGAAVESPSLKLE